MNIIWESWLGHFTDPESEAIVSRTQGKDIDAYEVLMTRSIQEAYRVLRPRHWMVLVFMNSSERVWEAARNAIEAAGFTIEKLAIFDKQHGTFKQFVSANAAGADLMIHCRKPSTGGSRTVFRRDGDPAEVERRVAKFIRDDSTGVPHVPFLHVRRAVEIELQDPLQQVHR